ncbi:MAG: hypothetical protein LBK95_19470, partial [Bifidobacteriaceae bacterium]|nr:hypothetical protein [Bifidobacteriaceae bacterium]
MAELTRAACGCELDTLPGFCTVHGEWQATAWTEPSIESGTGPNSVGPGAAAGAEDPSIESATGPNS